MAKGPSRIAALLIAPLIGVAVGWLAGPLASPPQLLAAAARQPDAAPPPTPVPTGNHSILVGPKACDLSISVVAISKGKKNVIWWNSVDSAKELWIEIDQEIFKKMVPGKVGKYRVDCKGASCFSHNVSDSVEPDPNKQYKYWQILVDPDPTKPQDKCDGMIIINP